MANWQKVTLTDKGAALLAKITARNLAFPLTRIAFGSGRPSNLNTATALAAQIDDAEIISKIQKDNTCTIAFRFNNTKFTKAYDICEFGIFATDPDDGEILFAVSTDSNPDHIQAASTSTVVTKTIVAGIGYNNSNNVTVTLSNVSWITAEEANDIAQNRVDEFAAILYQIIDTVQAVADGGTFPKKMNELANRLKAITGKSSWLTSPSITLEQALKSVTRSGDIVTVTAGNDSTTSFSIDNIASANALNVINAQDLRFDANNTTATTIRVGYSADNYSGSGISEYEFYNWKNSLANIKASKFIGNLQGTADYATYGTTMATTDNSTRMATTAFVQSIKSELVDNAPATLATLGKVATSINNDANYAQTVNNALALKAPLASPALTGTPTAPTAASGANTTQLATTAFVQTAISPLATTTYVNSAVSPKANTTYVDTKTNDKYSNVSVDNATLTFTNGAGSTKAVTVNNVANASAATTATTATYANNVNVTNNNEIAISGTIANGGTSLWIGNHANEGNQTITEYKFGNGTGTGTLAQATASKFNGPLNGNATTATTATYGVTQSSTDNSTKLATTAFVQTAVAPLATTTYVDTKTNDKYSDVTANNATLTFTNGAGSSKAVTVNNVTSATNAYYTSTQAAGDNTTKIASTAFVKTAVDAAVAPKAPLASPALTGTPTAPTPARGDNSTKIATTEFIQAIIAALTSGNINDFTAAAQTAATNRIVGDVSNANSWWVAIPCAFGKLCIEGGKLTVYNSKTTFTLPVSASINNLIYAAACDVGSGAWGFGCYPISDNQIDIYSKTNHNVDCRVIFIYKI